MDDSETAGEEVKICGTKSPVIKHLRDPQKVNVGCGHIVYFRRKPETDLARNNIRDAQNDAANCPQLKKSTDEDATPQQLTEMDEASMCLSDVAKLRRASLPSSSSTRCSISPSVGIPSKTSSPENVVHVHLNRANPSAEDPIKANVMLWEERYCRLQGVLKMLDQSDQHGYVQTLRSVSSVELSRYAAELEKRSIKLSLEEAKEMKRVGLINVVGKHGKNACTSSTQQEQLNE